MISPVRERSFLYALAVSSNKAPESLSEPTALDVRSVISSMVRGPAKVLPVFCRALFCSSSQSSRKNFRKSRSAAGITLEYR